MGNFKLAICQMQVVNDKDKNLEKAVEMLRKAADKGTDIAVLPEMFNCPYDNKKFLEYSESLSGGKSIETISQIAKSLNLFVVAGSIPELYQTEIFNTSLIFDNRGEIIGYHRKMHLFDIDIEGGIRFMESEILSPGKKVTVVETEFCKIGVCICYDIRFPELSRLMALEGAEVIILPGAFNMITGPVHWEILMRTRALDNQLFIAAASPARDTSASYVAYGNSMITSPWGTILSRAGENEEILIADIDLNEVAKVRRELPLLKHRRTDLYSLLKQKDDLE